MSNGSAGLLDHSKTLPHTESHRIKGPVPELFLRQALFSPNYQRVSKQSDTTDLLPESCGHDWEALPTYYDRSVMVMEAKVCSVVIALQERRAYYPPLCAASNGEGEGILSFTVMMHFKWNMPIIYHWKVIGAGALRALVLMPGEWWEEAGDTTRANLVFTVM